MSEPERRAVAYVLISHGAKHFSGELINRPGARPQLLRITLFVRHRGMTVSCTATEYARAPVGPESYPAFFQALGLIAQGDLELLAVDGLERLFRKLPLKRRDGMLEALEPYLSVILDARRNRLLSDFDQGQWIDIYNAGAMDFVKRKREPLSKEDARFQTSRARRVSKRVRGARADDAARQIGALRDELARRGDEPGNRELAREANARGLRTTRGKEWSDVAVARALRRLQDCDEDG